MKYLWVSLLPLTFFWTSAVHIYEPASLFCLLLVFMAAALSFFGYRARGVLAGIKDAVKFCALVLIAQGAVFPFYYIMAARVHQEPVFAFLASGLLNLFGVKAVCEGNLIYIDTFLVTIVFSSTIEKAGALFFILFTIGGVVCLLLAKARIKHFALFFAITFVYAVLRYVFVIMLFMTYSRHSLFWEKIFTFAAFIPYALILAAVFKALPAPEIILSLKGVPVKKAAVTGVLAFFLVFSGVAFFGLRDIGKEKASRVLVDEYHSDWEWTTDAYDEEWFGERSGYNYYCFYNLLEKYYETGRNMGPITGDTLKNADVFIMKTPTLPFSEEEVLHITDFSV